MKYREFIMPEKLPFDDQTNTNILKWLNGPYDKYVKEEIQNTLQSNPDELKDAFFQSLAFGTGGIRCKMGIGTNRLNIYTIQIATQGLANYINKQKIQNPSVVIGYDSRNHSQEFAECAACVLCANDIGVWLFDHLSPTPLVSYACREKKATSAIMITASHNPPDYNGYKVYWDDGAQVVPPHDRGIISEVNAVDDLSKVKMIPLDQANVRMIDQTFYDEFIDHISQLMLKTEQNKADGSLLKIIYSNLHGTGITTIPSALQKCGFSNISFVEKQKPIDGNFSYANYPNPEEKKALQLGVDLLKENKADLFMASDPDADRMGSVIWHKNAPYYLTGNQVACICLHYLIETKVTDKKMPPNPACIKTIVTSELFAEIANKMNVNCFDVLTGFKYIGEKIREWEEKENGFNFLFGAEESYGYLLGTNSRDKDATGVSCLLAEIALQQKKQEKTVVDFLFDIYRDYGIHREGLDAIKLTDSPEGMKRKEQIMQKMRDCPPSQILDQTIICIEDYQNQTSKNLQYNKITAIDLPISDVLRFWLEDGTKIVIRPSGTEPKIKIYVGVKSEKKDLKAGIKEADEHLAKVLKGMKQLMETN